MGQKKTQTNHPLLDQEKSQSAFLEAQSILPCTAHPACLTCSQGLKSGKEAMPAGQDVEGRGEGGFYKQIYSNIKSEGREGKRVGGAEAGPRKGSNSL